MFSPFYHRVLMVIALSGLFVGASLVANSALASGSKKRDPTIAIRLHTQQTGFDPTFAAKVRVGNPPREIIVEKIPSLSERDIASFYPYRASDGSYSVVLKLDRHGEATLEALSTEKRGSLLVVLVNGRPVTSLLIDKIIRDGIIFIPSGLTEANIKAMGASFTVMGQLPNGKPAPSAPAPESPLMPELPRH